MRGDQLANAGDDSSEGLVSLGREDDDVLGDDLTAEIGNGDGGLCRMDVESYDRAMIIKLNERGATATGKAASCTLQYPAVGNKLFDNEGDGTALETGKPRKIGSRDRRTSADEVEEQIPVNLPGGFVGGGLFAIKDEVLHR